MKKKIIWMIVVIIVLAGGAFWWKKRGDDETIYRSVHPKRGDISLTIIATGTVSPENRLDIKPPVSGRMESVLVQEGQVVKKGQILAWMSSSERAAMLDAARAEGHEEVKRWEQMYKPTPVTAPLPGTIILRSVESGQTVTASDAILTMSDRLTVKAQVDETDIAQIKLKQAAEITLDAYPSEHFTAMVDQIAYDAKTVNNVTTYVVDVLPNKTPEFMRSGMTANVNFTLDSKTGILTIPNESIKIKKSTSVVLLQNDDGKPVETEIKVGISDGKNTEVLSGVTEAQTLLVEQPKDKGPQNKNNLFNPMGNGPRRGGR